jgi:Zn-dependent metalloprotease
VRTLLGLAAAGAMAAAAAIAPLTTSSAAVYPERADSIRAAAVQALQSHAVAARASAGTGFVARSVLVDRDGSTHVRVDRTYFGLPVLGGDLVVHQDAAGGWAGASQTLRAPLTLGTAASVADAAAVAAALRDAAGRAIRGATIQAAPRLVVDARGAAPRLAWEVISGGVQTDGTPSRLASYVDARSGRLIRSEQQIETVDGSGSSLYSGAVPLQLTPSGSSYLLKDPTRGNTYTTDMNNASDGLLCQLFGSGCKTGTTFTSTDPSFGTGSNSNRESAGVDAQYGTNMTWDFYQTTFGRNGIFGDGTGSYNRVHYGSGYVNAFWDGTKMTYGDGDGTNYGPLVSLDVAGHEMSHGVTEHSANLDYSGESGGLNEATSDIFGTMVEWFAANPNDVGDYLIGEEFDLKNHLGFRRMDKPSSDGSSYDCWSSGVGNADVHYSSGVGNHFFYLLSEGSGAKTINGVGYNSPTCNGSTVTGIGQAAAGKIWYRALTVYMTSSTSYAGARTATMNAARDLYGAGSTQQNAVAAAWSAVAVN